jgi:hypothetical protein
MLAASAFYAVLATNYALVPESLWFDGIAMLAYVGLALVHLPSSQSR